MILGASETIHLPTLSRKVPTELYPPILGEDWNSSIREPSPLEFTVTLYFYFSSEPTTRCPLTHPHR
jgi:hypothetical protein